MHRFFARILEQVVVVLKDDEGGLGDMVMELAIIGAGAYSIFSNIRSGMADLGDVIKDNFTNTLIP